MSPAERLCSLLDAPPSRLADVEQAFATASELPIDLAFATALAGRLGSIDELFGLRLDDLVIAHHAALGRPTAVAAIRLLLEGLRGPLRRTGADPQQIDELLADLPAELLSPRDHAAPRIHGYAGKGALGGWLRVVAVRAMIDRRGKTSTHDDDGAVADLAAPDLDPELALLRRQYATEFRTAFAAAIGILPPDDRLLLRQHHLDGLGIDRLAALHGIHRATAARRLVAAREVVYDTVRRRLLAELEIGGQTFESLLRVVRSELDLSIDRYLAGS